MGGSLWGRGSSDYKVGFCPNILHETLCLVQNKIKQNKAKKNTHAKETE